MLPFLVKITFIPLSTRVKTFFLRPAKPKGCNGKRDIFKLPK